jgi:hypothetical protein
VTTRMLNDPQDASAAPNQHAAISSDILTSTFEAVFFNPVTNLEEIYDLGPSTIGFPREVHRRVDLTIYVIDVAAGDKIPRKGGPGIMKSDLLIINKIDLAPHVGASLEVMDRDARKMRGDRPFVFTNLKTGQGLDQVVRFIETQGMLRH